MAASLPSAIEPIQWRIIDGRSRLHPTVQSPKENVKPFVVNVQADSFNIAHYAVDSCLERGGHVILRRAVVQLH